MSDVDFKIGANSTEANTALDKLADKTMTTGQKMQSSMREASYKMASTMRDSTDKINGEFGRMSESANRMKGNLLAMTAVVAASFIYPIKGAIDMADSLNDLSLKTGIAVKELSAWKLVADQSGTSLESLATGIKSASKYMVEHAGNLEKIGIHANTAEEVIIQLSGVLSKMPADDPRRVALAVDVLGKSAMDLLPALSAGEDGLRKMLERGKELSVVDEDLAKKADQFNDQLSELKAISSAVFINLANDLLPVLTEMAQKFLDAKVAVRSFWDAWLVVSTSEDDYESKLGETKAKLNKLKEMRAGLNPESSVANKINDWVWGDVATLDKQIASAEKDIIALEKLVQLKNKRDEVVSKPSVIAGGSTAGIDEVLSSGGNKKDSKKAESRVGMWDGQLAEMRDAFEKEKLEQGSFQEFSKVRERDYWKNILDTVKLSTDERRAISAKYYALEHDLRKAAFDAEIADMKGQLNAAREGSAERIRIAGEMAIKVGEKYGLESKEYKAALDDMRQMAQAHQKQMEQLDALTVERTRAHEQGMLDLERIRIEESVALGEINNVQKLQKLAELKEQEFQLELQAAEDRAALLENDVVAYQQVMDKILEIKRKHELEKADSGKDIKVAKKKEFDEQFEPFKKAFDKSIDGVIQGTLTLKKAMKNLTQSIALEFAKIGKDILIKWIATQLGLTSATASGVATRVGIEQAGAAKSTAISGATSFKSIMNSAYEAMAGAYNAVVGIPIVGPYLAPVAAGTAFAAVSGFAGSVASARSGYDIPAGVNPMTQLHEREMVLPAQHADVIRGMADRGVAGGVHHHHYNIKAMDSRSFASFLKSNPDALAKGIVNTKRNFSKGI